MNKKFTSRILSMLLAMLMLVSMLPTSVFAAPASDIPAEMLDNVFLDALEYTGYKVQAQKDDGTIFKKYSGGATAYLSKISYGLNKYGTETVAKSGTATGLAPDIAGFESSGLCCASYISYVYYNYLPNIAGIDTSSATRPYNLRTATAYNAAANAWVSAGTARRISFSQNANGNNFIPSEDTSQCDIVVSVAPYSQSYPLVHMPPYYLDPSFCRDLPNNLSLGLFSLRCRFLAHRSQSLYGFLPAYPYREAFAR